MTRHRQRVWQRQTWMWAAGICTGIIGSLPYTPCSWSVVDGVVMSLLRLSTSSCHFDVYVVMSHVINFVKQHANEK